MVCIDKYTDRISQLRRQHREYSFRQLQFHDTKGASSLRFNAPMNYGDDLTDIRTSIAMISREHTEVKGFEAGRYVDGYRFVYPLFYHSEYVGSVELEISMSMVISKLYAAFKEKDIGFIVDKELVDSIVFEEGQSNYVESYISDKFYCDKEVSRYVENNLNCPKLYQNQELLESIREKVFNLLDTKQDFHRNEG